MPHPPHLSITLPHCIQTRHPLRAYQTFSHQKANPMAQGHGQDHGVTGGHPDMDYAEHEKTYAGFIRFSVIGTIWCITIMVGLAIGATGKSWGGGGLMVLLATVAAFAGIFVKSIDHKAVTAVFVLSMLIWAAKAL
jgi:Bacterial aa3 type cytochrome c oxidase subunit IV